MKKAIWKLKGGRTYQIKFRIADWGENEIAIEIHCDAGEILTEAGSRAKIRNCGFLRKQLADETNNVEYRRGIAVSWVSNESPRVSTSSYSGGNTIIVLRLRRAGC